MGKLIYGSGVVSLVEASNVAGIEIHYRGAFEYSSLIKDLSTKIRTSDNKVVIFTLKKNYNISGELFMYQGELSITKVIVGGWDAKEIPTTITRVGSAVAETITGKAEVISLYSEDLTETKLFNKKVGKTKRIDRKKIKVKKLREFPPHP